MELPILLAAMAGACPPSLSIAVANAGGMGAMGALMTVVVRLSDGRTVPALCFNLRRPPSADERNPQYASKLRALAARLVLPPDHVSSIS